MIESIIIGFVAGYFSGHFGLGGAIITSPALRLIVGVPAFTAVGTAMLVNLATSFVGAASYRRRGHVQKDLFLPLASSGMIGAAIGAALTTYFDGSVVLLITAVTLFFLGLRFFFSDHEIIHPQPVTHKTEVMLAAGLIIGLFSGFVGLGGGFLLVPFFRMGLKLDMKTAFGTSLSIIGAVTLPGVIVHYYLGHVDLGLGMLLIIGVIPGALIGARVALGLPAAALSRAFGVILTVLALYLGYHELSVLLAR